MKSKSKDQYTDALLREILFLLLYHFLIVNNVYAFWQFI